MAESFRRRGDLIVGVLDETERSVIVELLRQTRELVEPDETGTTGDPFTDLMATLGDSYDPAEVADRDPVVRRLLPDGHRDDPEAAAEFRAATERNLREQKTRKLTAAIEVLEGPVARRDRLELTDEQAITVMMALADVRLALGERLELRTDEDSERLHRDLEDLEVLDEDADPHRITLGLYYDFLTWVQESIALALMPR